MKDLESLPKLSIRGAIVPRDPLNLYGESFSAADAVDFLEAHKEEKHILVEISSDGGSVSEGKEIYNRLKQSGKKITTLTYKANSIAALLMLAGDNRQRFIVEGGDFMIHAARVYGEDLAGELKAEDLDRIKREITSATVEIVDIFCKILGEDRRTAILAAMEEDRSLGAEKAIKLGFANGYYRKIEPKASKGGLLITDSLHAIIQNKYTNKNDDIMSEKNSAIESILKDIKMGLASLLKVNKIRNQVTVKTLDGSSIYLEVADPANPAVLKDAKAFKVDEAGVPTTEQLEDGEYSLESGEVIVVASGVVSDVKPAVDAKKDSAELVAARKEIADLKAQLASSATVVAEKDKLVEDNKAAIAEMSKKFSLLDKQLADFKAEVPGDKGGKKEDKKSPATSGEAFAKMGFAQKTMLLAKEKRQRDNAGK